MESAPQRFARVLGALEDLVAQEAVALQNRDFETVATVQDRVAPLVEFLMSQPEIGQADAVLRARIEALYARRQQSAAWLAEEMARARDELGQADATQRRVARIAPVYGTPASIPRQLRAVG